MGKAEDRMAVVDSKGRVHNIPVLVYFSDMVLNGIARVYGVHSLRVIDASAFPLLPPGHPQATVCMLTRTITDINLQTY
jgi:hypothetical protein